MTTAIEAVQTANPILTAYADTAGSTTAAPVAALLPSPLDALALSGDPGAELAALAVKAGQAQQDTAQRARDADEQLEVNEDNQEVASMRQKASEIRDAGIADGLGMVAEGGTAAVAASFFPGSPKGDALKAGGKVANGGIQVGSAYTKAAEANRDADAAAHRASADQAKQAADDMHDAKKAGNDYVSAALDFYKEYTSAKGQANSAALHRA
jgi:hypothetical protein